jgi:hypothetical protein
MSAVKTMALSVVVWGTLVTVAQAAPLYDGQARWGGSWALFSQIAEGDGQVINPGGPQAGLQTLAAPSAAATAPTSAPVDAYLNFGTGPTPDAGSLTAGTPQPWYDSPSVVQAFGGQVPTPAQQSAFAQAVLADVQQTFAQSGMTGSNTPTLTLDPNAPHNHTLSVVSGLDYPANPGAIGITNVGHDGFSFIDNLKYANTPGDLEWAVAHNISHELMHAFGVSQHDDTTGQYLDAATANWGLLTSPNATFSPQAVSDMIAKDVGRNVAAGGPASGEEIDGDQMLASPVPEPATLAIWALAGMAVVVHRRRAAH